MPLWSVDHPGGGKVTTVASETRGRPPSFTRPGFRRGTAGAEVVPNHVVQAAERPRGRKLGRGNPVGKGRGSSASATGLGGEVSRDFKERSRSRAKALPCRASAAELPPSPCVKAVARGKVRRSAACRSPRLIRITRRTALFTTDRVRFTSQTTRRSRASDARPELSPLPTPLFEPATSSTPATGTTCVGTTPTPRRLSRTGCAPWGRRRGPAASRGRSPAPARNGGPAAPPAPRRTRCPPRPRAGRAHARGR